MKIIKKLFASVLSVSILSLSCMVPCAFAAQPTHNVDDFEDEAIRSGFSKFPNSGFTRDPQDSDVFVEDTSDSFSGGLDIVEDAQVDSTTGKVMQASNRSASSGDLFSKKVRLKLGYNSTSSVKKDAEGALRISYNFRFTSFAQNIEGSDAPYFFMMRNGTGGFGLKKGESDKLVNLSDITKGFKPELNKWYTLVSNVTVDRKLCSYILDADTNEVLLNSGTYEGYSGNSYNFYPVCFEPITAADGTTTVQIDNVEILHYLPEEYLVEMTDATVSNGDVNVRRNIPLRFCFNRPVTGSAIELKEIMTNADGEETEAPVSDAEVNSNVAGDILTLELPDGKMLKRNTKYKLSVSVSDENGEALCDDITFTTEDLHLWNDIENISASVNLTDSTKTDITFTLSDEYSYESFDGGIMAMLYRDKKMLDVDMVPLSNQDVTSSVTISFSFGVSPNAGDEIKLMLADMVNGFVPLAGGSCQYGN